ncbi:hypothetical protein LptCag_1053 [Leptospirillum ferriphilum]|uniref:Uncharacterized protein n=1 Tax=Leptospirillum ferriphilum TaxID=178606 RepID=A0A094WCQ1_9BACT|nr:hypothetical protein LptCag_1053 [Leptospirillum ferriphilum]
MSREAQSFGDVSGFETDVKRIDKTSGETWGQLSAKGACRKDDRPDLPI